MPASASPARILVVDDDRPLQQHLVAWLAAAGYDAQGAGSVAEAVLIAGRAPFDLAIVDLQLPDGSGIDLLQVLGDRHPRLVTLILTGTATVDTAVAALRHGRAYDLLRKPLLDLSTLQVALEGALAHRRKLSPAGPPGPGLPFGLSERENEVLVLLAGGLSNQDIADRAGISEKTVRNHLSAIYRKVGATSRTRALVIYQQWQAGGA